jgi:hypothetical protein
VLELKKVLSRKWRRKRVTLRERLKEASITSLVVSVLVTAVLSVVNPEIQLGHFSASIDFTATSVYIVGEVFGVITPWRSQGGNPINTSVGIALGGVLLGSRSAQALDNYYLVDFNAAGSIDYNVFKALLLPSQSEWLGGVLNPMSIKLKLNITYISENKSITNVEYTPSVIRSREDGCYELQYTTSIRDYYLYANAVICYYYENATLRVVNNESGELVISLDEYGVGTARTTSIVVAPKTNYTTQLTGPLRLRVRGFNLNYGLYWIDVRGGVKTLSLIRNIHLVLIPAVSVVFAVYTVPALIPILKRYLYAKTPRLVATRL